MPADLKKLKAEWRKQWERELRRAASALENDPSADCGTYVHDVECAILYSLRTPDAQD
jgi:hypothetical protein